MMTQADSTTELRLFAQPAAVEMRSAPSVPALNAALSVLYRLPWLNLGALTFATFGLAAVPLAATLQASSCSAEGGLDGLFILAFAGLVGVDMPLEATKSCLLLAGTTSLAGLVLQGLLFSVIVTKFSQPTVKLVFTSTM